MGRTREASAAHREVLADARVQLRRELTVQVLGQPGHHVVAGPTGLEEIVHGVEAENAGRGLAEWVTSDDQCARREGRSKAFMHPVNARPVAWFPLAAIQRQSASVSIQKHTFGRGSDGSELRFSRMTKLHT